jgi:hypothetical protein
MKLLSPTEAQAKAKKSLDSEKYRLAEVQTLITQKYKELSLAESDFDLAFKNQRSVWSDEVRKQEDLILSLRKTTEALEARKSQALIPLTERAKILDTRASALVVREQHLAEKELDVEETKLLLNDRLDEVAEREIQADKMAHILATQEEGARLQKARITADSARLTVLMAETGKEAHEREQRLIRAELALKGTVAHLEERERKVNEKEAGFANREKAIQDKRETLERAIKEIKQKYGSRIT